MGHRVRLGLGIFGIAGICAWLALNGSANVILTVTLWFGAVAFTVLGFRTLLGRVQTEWQDPPWPAPFDPVSNPLVLPGQSRQSMPAVPGQAPLMTGPLPASAADRSSASGILPPTVPPGEPGRPPKPDEPSNAELTAAVRASGKRIVQHMVTVEFVLSLIVLILAILLMTWISVDEFLDGYVVNGLLALGVTAFIGRYTRNRIRNRKLLIQSMDE